MDLHFGVVDLAASLLVPLLLRPRPMLRLEDKLEEQGQRKVTGADAQGDQGHSGQDTETHPPEGEEEDGNSATSDAWVERLLPTKERTAVHNDLAPPLQVVFQLVELLFLDAGRHGGTLKKRGQTKVVGMGPGSGLF